MSSHPTDDATDALARELAAKWTSIPVYDHEWQEMARFVQEREARAVTLAQREAYVDGAMWYAASIEAPGSAKEKAERLYPLPSERVPSDPPRCNAQFGAKNVTFFCTGTEGHSGGHTFTVTELGLEMLRGSGRSDPRPAADPPRPIVAFDLDAAHRLEKSQFAEKLNELIIAVNALRAAQETDRGNV